MKKIRVVLPLMILAMATVFCGCSSGEPKKELTVINYGEYLDPDLIDMFTEETGIEIKYEEALTPEEMYTKYCSGAIKYDLICSSDYMMMKLIKEGHLQQLDMDKLTNKGNIGDKYWSFSEAFDPGNLYTVPHFWGTIGILYDTTRVKGPVDSWDVLFNGDYSGQIVIQNNIRDTFMVTLKYLGYSLNTTNKDEIKEAQEALIAQKNDVQAYLVDEARDEVVAGNAIMAMVYSGEAYLGHEYNENLAYVVPKEGSNLWMDSWGVTSECEDLDSAMKFLDFLCREDVARTNFDYIYYSTPNQAVIDNMSEEERNDESLVPSDEATNNCEVCTMDDEETIEYMNELWKEFKAE